MSKYKVTRKEIKERYSNILQIGYCDAQHLLTYQNEFAYSTRAEGWACDYYNINGVIISTGYAPIGKKVDRNILRNYDEKAREITRNNNLSWEEKQEQVNSLLIEFLESQI